MAMGKRSWNELKIACLSLLESHPKSTSGDVSMKLKVTRSNASMILRRLYVQKLASRTWDAKGLFRKPFFRYYLTDRGHKRLKYLRSQQHVDSKIIQ